MGFLMMLWPWLLMALGAGRQMDRLMSADELAEYLSRPKATLYAWRYRGEGPLAIRVGRELRYRESDVLAWLDRLARESERPNHLSA